MTAAVTVRATASTPIATPFDIEACPLAPYILVLNRGSLAAPRLPRIEATR